MTETKQTTLLFFTIKISGKDVTVEQAKEILRSLGIKGEHDE